MDWKTIVEKYREDIIKDTLDLVSIPSKKDVNSISFDTPYGKALKDALDYMLNKADQDGFTTKNFDNHAGRLEYGTKGDLIGVVCHLDVVPEQKEGWIEEPYQGVVKNGVIYGRGSNDNKGPTIAVYYALKAIVDQGLEPKNRLHLIWGCDEESNMHCMGYYKKHTDEMPIRGFVPDCTFPVNYGEQGITTLELRVTFPKTISFFEAGEHAHTVAQDARAIFTCEKENVEAYFEFFLKTQNYQGEIKKEENSYHIHLHGVSAHGSRPAQGRNAACGLLLFLASILDDKKVMGIARLIENWQGRGFDIQHKSMKTGELTLCVGKVELNEGTLSCILDIRYPSDMDYESMIKKMESKGKEIAEDFVITILENRVGSYVDPNTPYVKKLEEIYRKYSHDEKTPMKVSAGDTYARKFEGLVAYGPTTPEHLTMPHIGQAHMPNEGMDIETLMMGCAIYAEVLVYLLECE